MKTVYNFVIRYSGINTQSRSFIAHNISIDVLQVRIDIKILIFRNDPTTKFLCLTFTVKKNEIK